MLGVRIKYQNCSLKFIQKIVFVQIYGGGGGLKPIYICPKWKCPKLGVTCNMKDTEFIDLY